MIRLTTLTRVLTDAAQLRLEEYENSLAEGEGTEPEEDMWTRMGIERPKMEEEVEEPESRTADLIFTEEDYEYVQGSALVQPKCIDLILDLENDRSEVYLNSRKSFTVAHRSEDIRKMMNKRGILGRLVDFLY